MCDILGLTIGNYEGFTCQASQGKITLPTLYLVHCQCIAVSEESWNQGLMPLSPSLLLCIIFFSSSGAFHLGVSIRTLGRGLSQKPLLTSSYWREEANLKTIFSTLTHYSALFPLLALPCHHLPPRFIKLQLQKPSTQGFLATRQHLHLSSTTWPSVWGGRWGCGE